MTNKKNIDVDLNPLENLENTYMNMMQVRATVIDPNILYAEFARAAGKTEGITGPRMIRVSNSMPGELGFLVHKTYTALLTNVWPNIQAYFSKPFGSAGKPMLEYGIDYVVGESKLPPHFMRPRYPISYPKHSIVFRNGFHWQLVASDQPESVAGRSGVHAIIEEMKHNSGEKLKTRLFPSLRGSDLRTRQCPYYQGITGVSDTARTDLGEDNWFESYEELENHTLTEEIVTVSLKVNAAMVKLYQLNVAEREEKDVMVKERMRLERLKAQRIVSLWQPRLNDMRRNAICYLRASSFVNKDILGLKFFKTQLDSLDIDEFLTSIGAIRMHTVVNRFFENYNPKLHQFSNGYRYDAIMKVNLKDHFRLTSHYLRFYNPAEELHVGYDPGGFSSLIFGQYRNMRKEFRIIKEMYSYQAEPQCDLATQVFEFFGADVKNKLIHLYPDRAGNKRREDYEQLTTDSRIMQRELESVGFKVILHNEGQATIYHWQQYKMCAFVFGGRSNALPQVLIDENECPNLCSSIAISPRITIDGRVHLDKTSEKKVPVKYQAGRSTQLPSAMIYLFFGVFGETFAMNFSQLPSDLPETFSE